MFPFPGSISVYGIYTDEGRGRFQNVLQVESIAVSLKFVQMNFLCPHKKIHPIYSKIMGCIYRVIVKILRYLDF
jgi:hypothetical protein